VLVADDDAPARAAVRFVLKGQGFVTCAETVDVAGTVSAALRARPDVCLLEVRMPGNGIAAAAEIASRLPKTAIVMFTVSRDDTDVIESLRAGASGYLLKDMDPARLPAVLHRVLAGETAVPRSLLAPLIDEFRARTRTRRPLPSRPDLELTRRECDVLELLRDGFTSAEMAERMGISQITVRRHVSKLLKKLRVSDRASAIRAIAEPSRGVHSLNA
jgi:DNA-binding NarL/FixJ family response regulator